MGVNLELIQLDFQSVVQRKTDLIQLEFLKSTLVNILESTTTSKPIIAYRTKTTPNTVDHTQLHSQIKKWEYTITSYILDNTTSFAVTTASSTSPRCKSSNKDFVRFLIPTWVLKTSCNALTEQAYQRHIVLAIRF